MQATRRGWFNELCSAQVDRVWQAVHRQPTPDSVARVIELLVPSALERSAWPSYVSDDHTPYEISLLVGGDVPQIRLMAEPLPLASHVTLAETVSAGMSLRKTLEADLGVSFARFDKI